MDIKALKFDTRTLEALQSLKLQVEINEKRITRPHRSIRELVDLIEIALRSGAPAVITALKNLCEQFNPRQQAFFKNLGIDLSSVASVKEKNISYRGAQLIKKQTQVDEVVAKPPHKKKKVIYRGQEKWV